MTIEDVKIKLEKIENIKWDDESAHIYEDELFYDFVEAIKENKYKTKKEIIKIATELFKVRSISFARWYA